MKKFLTLICLLAFFSAAYATPVSQQSAKIAGKNFLAKKYAPGIELTLVKTYNNDQNLPAIYVFKISATRGFVIVAGDDAVQPILGYSADNDFGLDHIPAHVQWWMDGYRQQISYVMSHHITATPTIAAKWNALLNVGATNHTAAKPTGVPPLLTTQWDQMNFFGPVMYNNLCPVPGADGTSTPTGCVATSTAQVMNYWQWPAQGTGSHSYDENDYGNLSANFGATTYDWANMPVSSSNPTTWTAANTNAVATLMYHVGVAVEMDYDIANNGGSGALSINYGVPTLACAQNALTSYFNYDPSQQGIPRSDYTDADWINALKSSLDSARPILYGGAGSEGGHEWVVDGYDDDNLFHCNWGWSGQSDGFYSVDNMAPADQGAGGGTTFNDDQDAIVNIHPTGSVTPPDTSTTDTVVTPNYGDLVVYATPNINHVTIDWNEAFTINSLLFNNTDSFFHGDYVAGVYRSSDNSFVQYIQPAFNQSIAPSALPPVTFATPGIPGMTPGEYYAKLLYRKNGSNSQWIPIPVVSDSIINRVGITVLNAPTGIDNISLGDLVNVYPNPANDKVNISLADFTSKVNTIELYSLDGKLLGSFKPAGNLSINLSSTSSGIYFLRFNSDAGIFTKKVIVKH